MPRRRLTATTLARLAAPRAAGSIDYFDIGHAALCLRVSRRVKAWCVFARHNGRLRRVLLGYFPTMGLAEARRAAEALVTAFRTGRDPTEREKNTVAAVAKLWLNRVQSKNRTRASVERLIQREIVAKIGQKPIASVRKFDLIELVELVADRGAEAQARKLAVYAHGLFEFALARESIQVNPAHRLKLPGRVVARDRVLAADELRLVWAATHDPALGLYGQAVRVLLLTGARRSEISSLAWSELDLTEKLIRLPATRSKSGIERIIPLSAAARAEIDALPLTPSPYVFPNASGAPIARWSAVKARIDAASGVSNWRLHDLRRTCATNLQRLGVKLEVIETVLGHTTGSRSGVVGTYQRHAFADEARHAINAWSAEVHRIVNNIAPDTNVVPLTQVRHPAAP